MKEIHPFLPLINSCNTETTIKPGQVYYPKGFTLSENYFGRLFSRVKYELKELLSGNSGSVDRDEAVYLVGEAYRAFRLPDSGSGAVFYDPLFKEVLEDVIGSGRIPLRIIEKYEDEYLPFSGEYFEKNFGCFDDIMDRIGSSIKENITQTELVFVKFIPDKRLQQRLELLNRALEGYGLFTFVPVLVTGNDIPVLSYGSAFSSPALSIGSFSVTVSDMAQSMNGCVSKSDMEQEAVSIKAYFPAGFSDGIAAERLLDCEIKVVSSSESQHSKSIPNPFAQTESLDNEKPIPEEESQCEAPGTDEDKKDDDVFKDEPVILPEIVPLGAFINDGTDNIRIELYADRILDAAAKYRIPYDCMFGYVMSHEMFHAMHFICVANRGGDWDHEGSNHMFAVKEALAEYFALCYALEKKRQRVGEYISWLRNRKYFPHDGGYSGAEVLRHWFRTPKRARLFGTYTLTVCPESSADIFFASLLDGDAAFKRLEHIASCEEQ